MRIRVLIAIVVVLWAADSVGHIEAALIIIIGLAVALRVARGAER